jgi:hypothetical protein
MWSKESIIYAAGIIDGEGSISIEIQKREYGVRKVDYYAIRLVVINTNLELMNWLLSSFGGALGKRKSIVNRRQVYTWSIHSLNASNLLSECYPYMIVKKSHAEAVIQFMNLKSKGTWFVTDEIQKERRDLYDKLKKINKHLI